MNSEELEQSLRTEFDSSLKNILADMKQEVSRLQENIESEMAKHKSHLNDVFLEFQTRIQSQRELDEGFKESVVEHLRLARDEGARITATAIAEAEELTKAEKKEAESSAPSVELSEIRDAINDISSQNSQSAILKSLINHAAKFTPRGAFFVVKNQHFVGWRVFGKEEQGDSEAITQIIFPLESSTILGESVKLLSAVKSSFGTFSEDSEYLEKLGFSEPQNIFAIPLIARGRGVAAIYADNGSGTESVNLEALETLVSVAGLTVELLAAAQSSNYTREPARPATYAAPPEPAQPEEPEFEASEEVSEPVEEHFESTEENYEVEQAAAFVPETEESSESFVDDGEQEFAVPAVEFHDSPEEPEEETEYAEEKSFEFSESADISEAGAEDESAADESYEVSGEEAESDETLKNDYAVYDDDLIEEVQTAAETSEDETESVVEAAPMEYEATVEDEAIEEVVISSSDYDTGIYESAVEEIEVSDYVAEETAQTHEVAFETNQDMNSTHVELEDSAAVHVEETAPVEEIVEEVAFTEQEPVAVEEAAVEEPAAVVQTPPVRTRFSDRNLDLPIEVSEDERRLHNDARRFARLLVSEIKLYNEQKVKEGRDANDLYDRLREALDRSREMYDKRVQPAVVERFDYFHYEVVNTLADGEEAKLGAGYPGATVS